MQHHSLHPKCFYGLARRFLKSWLSFPKRGASELGIFHPLMLGIKYPSQVYLESHMGNFISLQLSQALW